MVPRKYQVTMILLILPSLAEEPLSCAWYVQVVPGTVTAAQQQQLLLLFVAVRQYCYRGYVR